MRSRRSVFPEWKVGESLPLPFTDEQKSRPELKPASGADKPVRVASTEESSGFRQSSDARSLWLSVLLPELVLQSHSMLSERQLPLAVIRDERAQRRVDACSESARAQGVSYSMPLTAALALVPELHVLEFDEAQLTGALYALAHAAQRYTSTVIVEPPDALLLEIGASLTLFDGLEPLLKALTQDFHERAYTTACAVAPTAQAAHWLSRWRPGSIERNKAGLIEALRQMPLSVMNWPADVLQRFTAIGVHTLGECRRLPRDGFARRFGPARLMSIDRAYAVLPDPRRAYTEPEHFSAELELNGEIDNTDILLEACSILLKRLTLFLKHRQLQARQIRVLFYPLHAKPSVLTLQPARGGQNSEHWLQVLKIRLERWSIPAPAILVGLVSDRFEPLSSSSVALPFSSDRDTAYDPAATVLLLERLQARLGAQAVHALQSVADLRPERAMRFVRPAGADKHYHCAAFSPWHQCAALPGSQASKGLAGPLRLHRPLWLLAKPQRLPERPPNIVSGPERIETGWWDGASVNRDYYVAALSRGVRAWVFRERQRRRGYWYLHGYFA